MLPGKTYGPDDYLQVAWARKWVIVIPAVVIASSVFAWSYQLPNRYRAQTTIMIVPQRVPEAFVRPTITADVAERLQVISQQILSRTRLERIIQEFNLYETERRTMIMEDVVQRMRGDIDVAVARPTRRRDDASSFTVSFESSQPRTAMLVAERLASLFVQENLQDRALLADATDQFLRAQLEDARRRLIEHEEKLEAFRRRNAGRLPTQVQSNLQLLQGVQGRLQALADASNRDGDRLTTIENLLALGVPTDAPAPAGTTLPTDTIGPGPAAQQLEAARAGLRNLELRLKPAHPDIVRARRLIAELEEKAAAEAQQASLAPAAAAAPAGGVPTRVAALEAEAADIRRRLEARRQEEARLQKAIAEYSGRLESEETELMRDYATLQQTYSSLLRKSEDSKLAVNLERRQIGEQFRVLEGARLPERPFSPDRQRFNLMGLAAGLALGVALAGLLEYRDTTLKTDEDVVLSLSLPVLAVVPAMITARERRRTRRLRMALAFSAVCIVMIAGAAAAWKLGLVDQWVR